MSDRLALDVPEQIETARLLLRCPRPGDGAVVHASVVESLEALRAFPASLPWAMAEPAVEISETFCRNGRERYLARDEFSLLVFLRGTMTHIGNVGLHDFDWTVPKCELGYWGRTRFTRQGLVTEAVVALTDLAFRMGVRRVYALPDAENLRSCHLCERAGFTLEGVMHNDRRAPNGRLRSTRIYANVR